MGDVILFGLYTMHASTTNTTNRFRLSCDVRYQPANEPVDERWVGDTPRGHYRVQTGPMKEMAEARREWGV
jgi:ectoine hydroxylase-related dioxygenase (phytanoyl-CoA dioxygenase family)